jgi:succinyl-CoA synthetase beta subunit
MKIHEYQAKELFKEYGIPVDENVLVDNVDDAVIAYDSVGPFAVVKAQVLVGGRGKAGGVKLARSADEVKQHAKDILGLNIKGLEVEKILVAKASEIEKEYYVGFTLDRNNKRVVLMMTAEGGVEIEELAVTNPEAIRKFIIDYRQGPKGSDFEKELEFVFPDEGLRNQARDTIEKLYKLFIEKDCSVVEINPYALVNGTELKALDAKVNFDENAIYRHEDVEAMRNPEEDSEDEITARESGLAFVSMDGDIGCIVNGAGLAMATMDIIKLYGGDPANFLDVGGSSNPEKVLNALKIIMNNPKVKSILINIFGGITRCDDIANGILMALKQIKIPVPMVIRLIGTNDELGKKILTDAGFEVYTDLSTAVEKVVSIA